MLIDVLVLIIAGVVILTAISVNKKIDEVCKTIKQQGEILPKTNNTKDGAKLMKKGKVNIVIGGQAGSEGKGKMAAFLAQEFSINHFIMTASPNAGHTAYTKDGKKCVSYHIPVSAVMMPESVIFLTAASVINVEILQKECKELGVSPSRVFIDERAVVIMPSMVDTEKETLLRIGSTAQGVGQARIARLKRSPYTYYAGMDEMEELKCFHILNVQQRLANLMSSSNPPTMIMEMTQGFDLCILHGIDPIHCTTRIINPAAGMSEAGLPTKYLGDVYGVIRPFPIRVNNREGNSGGYDDADEITWEDVANYACIPKEEGFSGEITTTTKLPRRVFEFSPNRFMTFLDVCNPDFICVMFGDYIDYEVRGVSVSEMLTTKVRDWVTNLESEYNVIVKYLGTGAGHRSMVRLRSSGR